MEKGESYNENIIKELKEELGIKNVKLIREQKNNTLNQEYRHFTQWFKATINKEISGFTIDKKEVDEIKWFSKKEFMNRFNKNPEHFLKRMKDYFNLFG